MLNFAAAKGRGDVDGDNRQEKKYVFDHVPCCSGVAEKMQTGLGLSRGGVTANFAN